MYQNYIFDLYGTLVDIHTNEQKNYLWKKMCALFSCCGASYEPSECKKAYFSTIALLEQYAGVPDAEIQIEDVFGKMLSEKGVAPTDTYIFALGNAFRVISRDYIRLYPGVMEFLSDLRLAGKGIYLLSNAQRIFTEPEMRFLGIYDLFDGVFYSSDIGLKKPAPGFMEKLLDHYKLDRKKSIMIGNDVSCDTGIANACQMDSLYIHSNISPALTEETVPATFFIPDGDFTKIPSLILK